MDSARVVLLVRQGCHLCEDALNVVTEVCTRVGATWQSIDVDSDPELRASYTDHVPVTFVDGKQIAIWHLDADRLAEALNR